MMEQIKTFLFLSKTRHQIRSYKLNSIYFAKLLRESQRASPQTIPGGMVSGTFLVYSGVFANLSTFLECFCSSNEYAWFVVTNRRQGRCVECKVRAHVNGTWIHDFTISVFVLMLQSRKKAVIFRRTCNNVCLFRKHVSAYFRYARTVSNARLFDSPCCRKSIRQVK